ncbi:MAG: PEGA domain-containing protein [Halobacteriovoraceae bacterium]|jgi:hypothetical protein|nr:PEGA domain-containing protein [Halobacteriovoraceae bacterium]
MIIKPTFSGGNLKNFITLILLITFFSACSSTTLITSSDKDAKIYIDGEYKGSGSVTHTDTKIIGSSTIVKIKKKGCEPTIQVFSRNEEFDAGACAGGVFTLVPFLWVMKYKPTHTYEYECKKLK